ncbi:hypothetical protein L3X38_027031 [Prunus dulcis]|uniref:Uncharacterized protein n=1 Tax=Prunus dulcis TaxID=3755 RepID=A0AAD4VM57_PRUDU|nr:hypothetical protein L3X38_027031 [Prunus dulcis]
MSSESSEDYSGGNEPTLMGGSTIFGGGGRCGGLSWKSGRWHSGERWWRHHVDHGIMGGMALVDWKIRGTDSLSMR